MTHILYIFFLSVLNSRAARDLTMGPRGGGPSSANPHRLVFSLLKKNLIHQLVVYNDVNFEYFFFL